MPSPVYVGSIKPSVGHTEGCAGLAGVFRAIILLEKGVLLPTVGVEKANPKLKFDLWNLALPRGVMPWPAEASAPRRVSVNSFGFGGANAHVILEDAYHYMQIRDIKGLHSTEVRCRYLSPCGTINGNGSSTYNVEEDAIPSRPRLFVLSARDKQGIDRLVKCYKDYTYSTTHQSSNTLPSPEPPQMRADDIAYTLAQRRSLFDYRTFLVADSIGQLAMKLEKGTLPVFRRPAKSNGPIFVFTGQGAQWAGMGHELLRLPVFANSMAKSSACLSSLGCPFDLVTELRKTKEGSRVHSPEYSQPLCTSVQVALTDLLRDWSVEPAAVVGHSSGEIAAAYAGGIITHEDAIKVSYYRGVYSLKASQSGTHRGGMLATSLSEDEALALLENRTTSGVVTVACVNSPNSITLSGDVGEIESLEAHIVGSGKFARKLRVSTAYHSAHMGEVAEDCLKAMVQAGVGLRTPMKTNEAVMFSSVNGKLIRQGDINASYWIQNMCQPVLFSQAVQQLLSYSPSGMSHKGSLGTTARSGKYWKGGCVVEIGPHPALKAPWTQIVEGTVGNLSAKLYYSSMLTRGEDAIETALHCAGSLWAYGNPLALSKVNGQVDGDEGNKDKPRLVVQLPSYPWNHDRQYWHESRNMRSERLADWPRSDILGCRVPDQTTHEPQWRNRISIDENPWIEDHIITGTTLYPGAGMLAMVIEAAQQISETGRGLIRGIEFRHVHFERGLVVPQGEVVESQVSIKTPHREWSTQDAPSWSQSFQFTVFSSQSHDPWVKNCSGSFRIIYEHGGDTGGGAAKGAEDVEDPQHFDWLERVHIFQAAKKLSTTPVNIAKFYKELTDVGMDYGATFQNLSTLYKATDYMYYGTVVSRAAR